MVLVNGKEFKTYDLDTKQTLLSRVASAMKTLPRFLSVNILDEETWNVVDILSLIKEDIKEENTDFDDFVSRNKDVLENNDSLQKKDLLKVWLAYNTNLSALPKEVITPLGEGYVQEKYFTSINGFLDFWKTRGSMITSIKDELARQEIDIQKKIKFYNSFEEIEGNIFTNIVTEKVTLEIILSNRVETILELFNYVVLSIYAPFASCKSNDETYFKVLKNYTPPDEWTELVEDNIINLQIKNGNEFVLVKAVLNENNFPKFTFSLNTDKNNLSASDFEKRLYSIFPKVDTEQKKTISETNIIGRFFFPIAQFDPYVFSDLVMNNTFFSALISVDESTKMTKRKESGYTWVHINFNSEKTGTVVGNIGQKIVDMSDPELKDEDPELFNHGDFYIRVHFKGRDLQSILTFQKILSILFGVYTQEKGDIIKIYREFIPNFGKNKYTVTSLKKKEYTLQAPEVFVKNYTRNCSSEKMPSIVSPEELEKMNLPEEKYMKFPRDEIDDPEREKIPSDGKRQKYYICTNPDFPYPGLQKNGLENSREYPFVPCCFKTDQMHKEHSAFRHYFFGDTLDMKDKKQQELITTSKFLSRDQYGVLSQSIEKLFSTLSPESNQYRYIRVGVSRNKSSFLSCVLSALYEQTGIFSESDRDAFIETQRLALIERAQQARQSMYDSDTQFIQSELKNLNVYMNPKLYCQLLEEVYNCNIYIFNKEEMVLPRYINGYYRSSVQGKPVLIIYEHMGSESDHAEYPQCEIIVKWNVKKSSDIDYSFTMDSKVGMSIERIFNTLTKSYVLDKELAEIFFPIFGNENVTVTGQKLDNFGKCRMVNVKYKVRDLTLFTTPLPPLNVPEVDIVYVSTKSIVLRFLEKISTTPTFQTVNDAKKLIEIHSILGNVEFSVKIEPDNEELNVPYKENSPVEENNTESMLGLFNFNKRIARYLTEYTFWLFSNWAKKKSIQVVNDEALARFGTNKMVVVPDFQYTLIKKEFNENSPECMQGKKLVCQNETILKRLLYVLKLATVRDLKMIEDYHTRKSIQHYYSDLSDFDTYPNQSILQGEYTIQKWIQEASRVKILENRVMPGQRTPYFFRNELISDKIYLAQNCYDIQGAFEIAISWQQNGYNIVDPSRENKESYSYTLYDYETPEKIEKQMMQGDISPEKEISLIGYTIEDDVFYTVLMDLEPVVVH